MNRKSDHPISEIILNRWSPRAMTGESLSQEELMALFEAARWAPSAYNNQPWRFVYARRDTSHFDRLFDLLIDFNKSWCRNAAVLAVVIAGKNLEKTGKPSVTHAYDTGAAWENLALEGTRRGLVIHGMQGFDYEKAQTVLNIPQDYAVLAMFAAGKPAPKDTLPPELQERELPSSRKKIEEFVFEGTFGR